ncbi:MAG: hypothetical protein A2340_03575 [Lentisphaerae bacterium RIFOXYB12_FULL_60_10]|nr:MAG: hypothetical protein A2340_03575 [Lentisphaerae bacterium RIFOXYB12_FULL_60_10]
MKHGLPVLVTILMTVARGPAQEPAARVWSGSNPPVEGSYRFLIEDHITIQAADGKEVRLPFNTLSADDQALALQLETRQGPVSPPGWLAGYKVRFPIQIVDPPSMTSQTVIARIPTGGWLKPDASDFVILTRNGRRIPAAILSHDPLGDTLCQFRRNGVERWYWVYAANPAAPDRDRALENRIASSRKASEQALLAKMAAQKRSADRAAELRDTAAEVEKERTLIQQSAAELTQWQKLLPERETAAQAAAEKVPPAQAIAQQAAAAHAPFEKEADAKTAAARIVEREAADLRAKANQLKTDRDNTARNLENAREQVKTGTAALAAARTAAEQARRQANTDRRNAEAATATAAAHLAESERATRDSANTPATDPTHERKVRAAEKLKADAEQSGRNRDAARQKADQSEPAARQAEQAHEQAKAALDTANRSVTDLTRQLETLRKDADAAEAAAVPRETAAKVAGEAANAARLAAAPTATAKATADQTLAQLSGASQAANAAVTQAKTRINEVTKIKTDAEARLAALMPRYDPLKRAADEAAAAVASTVTNAVAMEKAYFDLAYEAEPRLFKEGMTVEFRDWAGDRLASWPAVVEGLQKSDNVIGAAVVGEILQNVNPFRRHDPRNFAASYRGYFRITQPGIYSFFANGDDAAFLFINGYRVYSRTGSNPPIRGRTPLYAVGADIELEAGIHPFEVHHIVGNTPAAIGLCTLSWIVPGGNQWQFVPREAFTTALTAIPAGVESFDGKPVALFDAGMDDTLTSDGITLYVARFAAQGNIPNPGILRWDFGDGTTRSGNPSPHHVYFDAGVITASLASHPSLPPFKRRCQTWVPPLPANPLTPDRIIQSLAGLNLARLPPAHLCDLYHFLTVCDRPARWAILEPLTRQLLANRNLDVAFRARLNNTRMEALARLGKTSDALALHEPALREAGRSRTLRMLVQLGAANVQRDPIRDYRTSDGLYASILDENLRVRHPLVRQAAVAWGDMLLDAGETARAGAAYRAAMALGQVGATGETPSDAVERGALLRIAEQQLRAGNTRQTRRLLERIENEFPEQKLEGMYRFLRGDAERAAGRYEIAARHYEVLLQLAQWAGYHPAAMAGIADCYYRMNDHDRAGQWLRQVEARHPEFYQQRNLAELAGRVAARQALTNAPPPFQVSVNGFTDPALAIPPVPHARVIPALGFGDPGAAFMDSRTGTPFFTVPLAVQSNLPPQGTLFVEIWYRDTGAIPGGDNSRHVRADVGALDGPGVTPAGCLQERTYGQWLKAAMPIAMPPALHGRASVAVYNTGGFLEVDAARIEHADDEQLDALSRYLEGADPQ